MGTNKRPAAPIQVLGGTYFGKEKIGKKLEKKGRKSLSALSL